MLGTIYKGQIPLHWKQGFASSAQLGLSQWIADLIDRFQAMDRYHSILTDPNPFSGLAISFWLGGLFVPEAFITATRQIAAQTNGWNLEDLVLCLETEKHTTYPRRDGFSAEGFILEGAEYLSNNEIALTDRLRCRLPLTSFRWRLHSPSETHANEMMGIPLYLNEGRNAILVVIHVEISKNISRTAWAQRSVSFLLQSVVH